MQNLPSRVVVLATGGTIAGTASSPQDDLGYRSATLPVEALLGTISPPAAALEAEQVAQVDSKNMSFAIWTRLAARIAHHAARPEVTGIVVTHGTDTLEETAWFLERLLAPDKPVVLTGAMRPATSAGADGPRNLGDAMMLAVAPGLAGVVVVMHGAVHAARDVGKRHPRRLDAFSSGEAGPVAVIEGGRLRWLREAPRPEAIGLAALPADPAAWPRVEIVTSTAGADGAIVPLLVDAGVAGIVVATTGNGTVNEVLEACLREAMQQGVAVLRSTRCTDGAIVEKEPGDPNALPVTPYLGPAKARVELILRLLQQNAAQGAGKRPAGVRRRRTG